jgi:hypothetical protein
MCSRFLSVRSLTIFFASPVNAAITTPYIEYCIGGLVYTQPINSTVTYIPNRGSSAPLFNATGVPGIGTLFLKSHPIDGFAYVEYNDSYIDMGGTIPWDFGAGVTIITIASAPATGGFWSRLFELTAGESGVDAILLARVGTGSDMAFHVYNPSQTRIIDDRPTNVLDGQWKVFAATMSTYRYSVYIDGTLLTSGTVPGGINDRNTTMNWLGKSSWVNDALAKDMGLRQLAIYHQELTQAEVATATATLIEGCPTVAGFVPPSSPPPLPPPPSPTPPRYAGSAQAEVA